MKDVKLTDFSDEELTGRLATIKRQEALERKKAKQQFLEQYSADSILAELRKRRGEEEQYEKEQGAKEDETTIPLIIFCTFILMCAFFIMAMF